MQKRVGDFTSGTLDRPRKGGAGYLHPLGALLLVELFEVRQPDRFEFVRFEFDALQLALPDAAGFEAAVTGGIPNMSTASLHTHRFTFNGHMSNQFLHSNGHMFICQGEIC